MQSLTLLLALGFFCASASAASAGDRTITKVVKALQEMLDKSKADGDAERELFAKHKCYCDTNEAAKKASIEKHTTDIGMLESKIEELQAATGGLSEEVAQLRADMSANEEARATAEAVRAKENEAFVAEEADLTGAIGQMKQAIDTLSEIGGDQTLAEAAADHKQYMRGNQKESSLLNLHKSVKAALIAASALMSQKQNVAVEAFLQAPFTATYTAQSGEVVGILKDMRDTFESNLATARSTEKIAAEAHGKFMTTKQGEYDTMSATYDTKQAKLGDNDGKLSTNKEQLQQAIAGKAEDESFLSKLLELCAGKEKDYDKRKVLRANEQVALAEAISILNSDAAFESFSKVTATKLGATGLVQLRSVRTHNVDKKQQALSLLLGVHKSGRLAKIAGFIQAGNPFTKVLEEIKKMIALIEKEEKADDEQLAWCNEERTTNDASHAEKVQQISELETEITDLTTLINDPSTGLKAQIATNEDDLTTNGVNQAEETSARKEANIAYQKDIANVVEAERILEKAIVVLKGYYAKLTKEELGLLQRRHKALLQEDPALPDTWENDNYKGQSEAATGSTGAIGMLEFILENTKREETEAHSDEEYAQHSFEDSMAALKEEEKNLQESLASLRVELTTKEKELLDKEADLKTTQADKASIEAYLESIKSGCDFITANINTRKANRASETEQLNNADTLLRGTPAYQAAVAQAHDESLGKCLDTCKASGEAHVDCKACLAGVTVPGYCAGHKGTEGC